MSEKKSIVVLCGGQSAEHEISILSARNVISTLESQRFNISVVYLSQAGRWFLVDPSKEDFKGQEDHPLALIPGNPTKPIVFVNNPNQGVVADCVIPMLHGTCGEDGSVQGLLDILNVPYVGSDVLGSALCMHKHIMKRLLQSAKLPTVDWISINNYRKGECNYNNVSKQLGSTFFVKSSALGSSIGISKVHNEQEYEFAVHNAFQYDHDVIAERAVIGREVECSVLGNDNPVASVPGELVTSHDFYSYEAKYLDPDGAQIIIPTDLPESTVQIIQNLAIDAFEILQCSGMARVDFFVTEAQSVLINEVNTIPGFTDISFYPKSWEVSDLSYPDLLVSLIQLAIEKYNNESTLSRQYLGPSGCSRES